MDVAGRMALQKADGSLVALAAIVPNSEQSSSPSWIQTGLRKDCMRTHLVRVSSHVDILLRSIPCFASKRNKEVKDRARPFLFLSPKNKKNSYTTAQQWDPSVQRTWRACFDDLRPLLVLRGQGQRIVCSLCYTNSASSNK